MSGRVVDVCDFGAFVDIGHATRGSRPGAALLHISQLSDQRVGDVRDFLKVGDIVEAARVIRVDLKRGEVGLSLRPRRPARRDFRELRVGARLEGRVASVLPYGAFVDVGASVNGESDTRARGRSPSTLLGPFFAGGMMLTPRRQDCCTSAGSPAALVSPSRPNPSVPSSLLFSRAHVSRSAFVSRPSRKCPPSPE